MMGRIVPWEPLSMSSSIQFREPFSGFSHLVGAVVAAVALLLLVLLGDFPSSMRQVLALAVYGTTLVAMFTASSLYHLLPLSPTGVRRLRRFDHAAIYLFIAGTYTPFCLVSLQGTLGTVLLAVVWSMAVIGVTTKLIWIEAPSWVNVTPYLIMGWSVVPVLPQFAAALTSGVMAWVVAGGVAYSLGAVIYTVKKPDPFPGVFGFHEIWHLFVLAAALFHGIAVWGVLA